MHGPSMRLVAEAGTHWPIPATWEQSSKRAYRGLEGLLQLSFDEGDLIDPARCRGAEEARPGRWELAGTRNGIAVSGTYVEASLAVNVYTVRAVDLRSLPEADLHMAEIQATYVFTEKAGVLEEVVKKYLGYVPIHPDAYGELDEYGHAAMGPIPVLNSWKPVGEYIDNTPRGAAPDDDADLLLVGGGWLVYADPAGCCGFVLQPLPWPSIDRVHVERKLGRELGPKGYSPTFGQADVAAIWDSPIADNGTSYHALDKDGRLVGAGAFWADNFDQPWHLQYGLHPRHAAEVQRAFRRLRS